MIEPNSHTAGLAASGPARQEAVRSEQGGALASGGAAAAAGLGRRHPTWEAMPRAWSGRARRAVALRSMAGPREGGGGGGGDGGGSGCTVPGDLAGVLLLGLTLRPQLLVGWHSASAPARLALRRRRRSPASPLEAGLASASASQVAASLQVLPTEARLLARSGRELVLPVPAPPALARRAGGKSEREYGTFQRHAPRACLPISPSPTRGREQEISSGQTARASWSQLFTPRGHFANTCWCAHLASRPSLAVSLSIKNSRGPANRAPPSTAREHPPVGLPSRAALPSVA